MNGEVYPELVRARVAAGWPEDRARSTPATRRARLTEEQVLALRASLAPAEELAAELGITPRQVRRIRAGIAWKGLFFTGRPNAFRDRKSVV